MDSLTLPKKDGVEYRLVPGYDGAYAAGNDGSVWSRRKRGGGAPGIMKMWRQLKGTMGNYYRLVKLSRDCNSSFYTLHRVILEAFVGLRPDGYHCRHLNGDPLDNRLDNLCWGTALENMQDQYLHGTRLNNVGSKHSSTKLHEDDITAIRNLVGEGLAQRSLAICYKVSRRVISSIVTRRTWKHVK